MQSASLPIGIALFLILSTFIPYFLYMRDLTCTFLKCWYLDTNFLDRLIEEYGLDIDYDEILFSYWYSIKNLHINIFIYEAFSQIKDKFFEECWKKILKITWKKDLWYVNYEIFTNCIDSSLWFTDNEVQDLFEQWDNQKERF